MNELTFFANLVSAILLGALIGVERQFRQRMAGLRTNALVSAGAALFVMVTSHRTNFGDDTRIAAQIVSGVGFLCAGVIMRDGFSVRGLNTAATIWCSAAVGTFAGLGEYGFALIGACGILLTNLGLKHVARKIDSLPHGDTERELHYLIKINCQQENESEVRQALVHIMEKGVVSLQGLVSENVSADNSVMILADLCSLGHAHQSIEKIVAQMTNQKDVISASWLQQKENQN